MKKAAISFAVFAVIVLALSALGKRSIYTEIIIHAPVDKVWKEFTDFDKYPDWNPFIRKVSGDIKKGNAIEVTLRLAGKDPMVIRPEVIEFERERILQWEGRLLLPGIFTGRHTFQFVKIDAGKTKLIHKEDFNGVLINFFNFDSTIRGFDGMNTLLKQRVEAGIRRK